jgi:hypothetical protein
VEPTRGGNEKHALFTALSEAADIAAIAGEVRLLGVVFLGNRDGTWRQAMLVRDGPVWSVVGAGRVACLAASSVMTEMVRI